MAADQFISFFTYYVSSMLFGLFLRRFAVSVLLIVVVWHYWIYGALVGSTRAASADFRFFLPLVAFLGVAVGYSISSLLNLRRLIFWKRFDLFGLWLPLVLIEFIVMHLVFVLWETTGTFTHPINYILTFIACLMLIPLWYFLTNGFSVWAFWDDATNKLSFRDHAAFKFHAAWATFQLTATLIFTIFEWALPNLWPFAIAMGVFAFHVLLWLCISMFVVTDAGDAPYKVVRGQVVQQLERVGPARKAFFWPFGTGNNSAASTADFEMQSTQQPPPAPSRKSSRHPPGASGAYTALAGYEA